MGRKTDQTIEEKRQRCIKLLTEILGYTNGIKMPTNAYSHLKEYKDTCGYDVVYETIKLQRDSIEWALENKHFRDERNKVNYIFAIIQNNIMDTIRLMEAQKKKARSVQPVSEEDMMVGNAEKKKVKDISAYVTDD